MQIVPEVFSFFAGIFVFLLGIGFMVLMINLIDVMDENNEYLILRVKVVFSWGLVSLALAAALLFVMAVLTQAQGIS